MDSTRNPYLPGTTAGQPPSVERIGKRATRAVLWAAAGSFLFPPVGLLGWMYGHQVLKSIRVQAIGHEHRAAGQVGVVAGWLSVLAMALWLIQALGA